MLLDVGSVLKSLNAIESVLFIILSGVLATVKRRENGICEFISNFILATGIRASELSLRKYLT